MRGRRATKKKEVVDDRPFNYPPGNKQQQGKQAKLKKLWLGDVVESDEGWCSGGTVGSLTIVTNNLFNRDNSEASLSSGLGEEDVVVTQKKDVKSNSLEPVSFVKLEDTRTPLVSTGTTDDGDQRLKFSVNSGAEGLRCPLSPPPPNPNSPNEVSTYISFYLRRNLALGKNSRFLLSPDYISQKQSSKYQRRKGDEIRLDG